MSEHEWQVFAVFGGPDVEAGCEKCGKTLAAHEIDSRLMQRDDLLAACKIALPILEEYTDGYLEDYQADFFNNVVEPMKAAIAAAEKE